MYDQPLPSLAKRVAPQGRVFCFGIENLYYRGYVMNIEIRKLTPDLAEEYACFFDTTQHNDTYGHKCYCVSWRSDDTYFGDDDHWYSTAEERRTKAVQYIKDGKLQGYLAFDDGKVIGWCNATADCKKGVEVFRSWGWQIEKCDSGSMVKSIFCFVIAPETKRKGVATQMLAHVCKDAADDGFDFVEGYTNDNFIDDGYRGPLAMYEKCGFIKHSEHDGKIVMRKAL
ncbi:MAG: GNAT family N-acetyltransferase [Oscillospiraceae bacterium]|nr:GNAT family N-acetyltransferase [Oscillospiraceae bacterium]